MRDIVTYIAIAVFTVLLPRFDVTASETLHTAAVLETAAEPVRIVAFGDSVTGVYYHTGSRRAWCDMLGEALRRLYPKAEIQMFNAGISGHTSGRGLARIDRDVIIHKPHLVVVMFGMNDCCSSSLDDFRVNTKAIVKRCRSAGAEVVLCTPNSVYANMARPQEKLAKYAQAVRDVAAEMDIPLADCYQVYEAVRNKNNLQWRLLMSDTIHPNMNGHRLFAEEMAKTISGKVVSLCDVLPPDDALAFTIRRLSEGKTIKIVAMEPYDKIMSEVLRKKFPGAKIETVPWPVKGKSLADIEAWAGKVRSLKPDLVVFAVPTAAVSTSSKAVCEEEFVKRYCWALALCFDFAHATFDTVPVLPSVYEPLDDSGKHWEGLATRIIQGYDVECIERSAGCTKNVRQIIADWIEKRMKAFEQKMEKTKHENLEK